MAVTAQQAYNKIPPSSQKPVGLGLRSAYYRDFIEEKPDLGWVEIHPENYFGGGAPRHYLHKVRENYPLSFHAVGLSLGSDHPVSKDHLQKIKELAEIFQPFQISDHASWSASGNAHLNDLLPLPYTYESLGRLCQNINQTQDYLGQTILVENPSTYLSFKDNHMSEHEFMNEAAKKTGCGILLDVNNVYVQSHNHGFCPTTYIDNLNHSKIGEIHLAGHTERQSGSNSVLIDTHNQCVRDEVWKLFEYTIGKTGEICSLIEWDQDFPPFQTLLTEAQRADSIMRRMVKNNAAV